MPEPTVVDVAGVTFTYGDRVILDDVSFAIELGSFTGLIGPNGAGKTTLIKLLLGQIECRSGRITLFGHPPGRSHSFIGYVPQSSRFRLDFPITTREVVMMGRYSLLPPGRRPTSQDRMAVEGAMLRSGVGDLADKQFGSLSGGQRQKGLIARALAGSPRLLLLDEPTTGVDVVAQDSFYHLLEKLRAELNITILLVSHDIGVISSHVDNLICVNQKIFCHAPPDKALGEGLLGAAYGAEMEQIMHHHDIPHRTVRPHDGEKSSHA